jgi:hypothetical protein
LSFKTFFIWLTISVYQGAAIMIMSLILFENEFLNIVSISFTALILNELIMVALEITTWHTYMVIAEVATLLLYMISMTFLPEFFGTLFVIAPSLLTYASDRLVVCPLCPLCMEGSTDRCCERTAAVDLQGDPEPGGASGVQQATMIYRAAFIYCTVIIHWVCTSARSVRRRSQNSKKSPQAVPGR